MQELPYIAFFNAENTTMFWQYVKALLYVAMPLILIYIAVEYAEYLLIVLRKVFTFRGSDDRESDDYKYKYEE